MNKVVFQLWEESVRGQYPVPNGCSIHLDLNERIRYINSMYQERIDKSVPSEYESPIGGGIIAFVEDSLFKLLVRDKSIRLTQYQLNNLKNMDEITLKEEI